MVFACIITPVFDPCLPALKLLRQDLLRQDHLPKCEEPCQCFQQILISNGSSPDIKKWVKSLKDPKFVYDEISYEDIYYLKGKMKLVDTSKLLVSLRKRRNHGLNTYQADRYFFWDADLKILKDDFLAEIYKLHSDAEMIIAKVKYIHNTLLPKYPIDRAGKIDLSNYSISAAVARKYQFSICFNPIIGMTEDYRLYSRIRRHETVFHSNSIFAKKDGYALYQRLSTI